MAWWDHEDLKSSHNKAEEPEIVKSRCRLDDQRNKVMAAAKKLDEAEAEYKRLKETL